MILSNVLRSIATDSVILLHILQAVNARKEIILVH